MVFGFFYFLFSYCLKTSLGFDFSKVADSGNYTCDEMIKYLGTEKHYANKNKEHIFSFLKNKNCFASSVPAALLPSMEVKRVAPKRRELDFKASSSDSSCSSSDTHAVIYFSNFSINNNFSHFLHSLLRLFCALIDARWIEWEGGRFVHKTKFAIWLDPLLKMTTARTSWLSTLLGEHNVIRTFPEAACLKAENLLYGNGCVKLLPPEKWFGYPGCRSQTILPAYGAYMRQIASPSTPASEYTASHTSKQFKIAFVVREQSATSQTGERWISNLGEIQSHLRHYYSSRPGSFPPPNAPKDQVHHSFSMENITFETIAANQVVKQTVQFMADVDVFVSVHGAAMTNMFFMRPGSAVVELLPYPLCHCRSPDYFYGVGGYYHSSSAAQGINHYTYCIPQQDLTLNTRAQLTGNNGGKCSWKDLHSVKAIRMDPHLFLSLFKKVERDFIVQGKLQLVRPIINMSPNANGR